MKSLVFIVLLIPSVLLSQPAPPSLPGGGSGSVTSFSSTPTVSPFFTTSVATPTTTPALSFTVSNAAQNSVLAGPAFGGAGIPTYQLAPTFSAANLTSFPIFNQNTTGSAGSLAAAYIDWNAVSGGAEILNKPTIASQLHAVNIGISGSPIATGTGSVSLPATANFTCTINKAQVTGNASGSITVDIWKSNAAIPSSGNKISATAPVTLSSAQLNQNSALTGWTTSVAPGDVFWASVATVDGVLTNAIVQIWCQ
jgi:hypothetical protein